MSDNIIDGGIDQLGKRVGVFGGTFDPVHNGHCTLVSQFKRQCSLDSIIVIPALNPPHKLFLSLSDFEHRFQMLLLAFSAVQGVFLSRIEQLREGPSFTIDTLHHLKSRIGGKREWFFAIGEDSLAEMHTWKQYQDIPDEVCLTVFNRKLASRFSAADIVLKMFPDYRLGDDTPSFFKNNVEKIRLLHMPDVDTSSSQIRQSIANNEDCHDHIPKEVSSYLAHHSLYK